MKDKVTAPAVVAAAIAGAGILGFYMYRTITPAGPPPEQAPRGLSATPIVQRTQHIPRNREEGMAIYRQMMHQNSR